MWFTSKDLTLLDAKLAEELGKIHLQVVLVGLDSWLAGS